MPAFSSVPQILLPLVMAGVPYQLPAVLAALLLVLRLTPAQREGLGGSLSLYGLGLAGLIADGTVQALGLARSANTLGEVSVLILGLAGVRLGGLVLFRVLLPAVRLTPPRIVEDLVVFAAYVVWGIVRLSHLGLDLSGIVTTSAVITGIVAFSLQDTLGNILGGMALQLETSIRIGDWIRVDDTVGRVVDIRWRSTVIETRNWETVVIPNSLLMKSRFMILGRRGGQPLQWRRWVWFHVGLATPPQRVIHAVHVALRRAAIPNVATDPAPNCILMDINEGLGHYAVRYWLKDLAADDPTDSAVRVIAVTALQRAHIALALPETRQHVVEDDEKLQERQREADIARCTRALAGIELFAGLTEAERAELAQHMIHAPFLAGETMTAQGDVAHWLYVLTAGEAQAVLDEGAGRRRVVGSIRAGAGDSFFGEMGMLTGEPRSASVVAVTDAECYRLDKEGFEEILRARPAIAEDISGIMARRRAGLVSAMDEAERKRLVEASRGEFSRRIKRFFGLEQ